MQVPAEGCRDIEPSDVSAKLSSDPYATRAINVIYACGRPELPSVGRSDYFLLRDSTSVCFDMFEGRVTVAQRYPAHYGKVAAVAVFPAFEWQLYRYTVPVGIYCYGGKGGIRWGEQPFRHLYRNSRGQYFMRLRSFEVGRIDSSMLDDTDIDGSPAEPPSDKEQAGQKENQDYFPQYHNEYELSTVDEQVPAGHHVRHAGINAIFYARHSCDYRDHHIAVGCRDPSVFRDAGQFGYRTDICFRVILARGCPA